VDTGSGHEERQAEGKDFFDVERNPLITFRSTKVTQTGPDTVEFEGDFTIRGSQEEKLAFQVTGKGTGSGSIKGIRGLRPEAIRHEQRHSLHQNRRPRGGERRS
jgi:polyisoprenoid-binding protein YceI